MQSPPWGETRALQGSLPVPKDVIREGSPCLSRRETRVFVYRSEWTMGVALSGLVNTQMWGSLPFGSKNATSNGSDIYI